MTQENLFNNKPMDDTAQDKIVDSGCVERRLNGPRKENAWSCIELRAKEFPQAYRGHYLRAMEGNSRQSAIRANCLMCMGYNTGEVHRCTATACPLYGFDLLGARSIISFQ
jgi:hypothetical protein